MKGGCWLSLYVMPKDSLHITVSGFIVQLCIPSLFKALASLPAGLCEMLRTFHIYGLRNNEVQLLKDSPRLTEHKDTGPQVGRKKPLVSELHCLLMHAK